MYDLLIKNGRIADGSGMPSFIADVGIVEGRITDIGHLGTSAREVIDASGLVVAPGFIDNHCHFDAQVTWDPLCTFSPQHGVTTVIFGNCSLTLAPTKPEDREDLAMMLSRVEAIPMESLKEGIPWEWTSFGEYLDAAASSHKHKRFSFLGDAILKSADGSTLQVNNIFGSFAVAYP